MPLMSYILDLPLSMGYLVGLNQFGAGTNLDRNPIEDHEMLRKYRLGPDHMVDYLEKRMVSKGKPTLKELSLPFPVFGVFMYAFSRTKQFLTF
jgi:hypothetical protein